MWYPHTVPFLKNKIHYPPLKPSKPCRFGRCSIPDVIDLKKNRQKIVVLIVLFYWTFLPFFRNITRMPLFSRISSDWFNSKLKHNGIFVNLLQVLHNLINNRRQKFFWMVNFLCEEISVKKCLRVLFKKYCFPLSA